MNIAILLTIMTLASSGADPSSGPLEKFLPLGKGQIALNTPQGKKMLMESKAQAYWDLTNFYAPQHNSGSCSVASCIMVLNALPVPRPEPDKHRPYRLFTPENFFTQEVAAILLEKNKKSYPEVNLKEFLKAACETVSGSGMTLEQLDRVMSTHPVRVERFHAKGTGVKEFRKRVAENLACPNKHVVVNYLRKSLGQVEFGHISPLGAYHKGTDMVLILDTANYKYPWTWVPVDDLWRAMAEVDSMSKQARGYLCVLSADEANAKQRR